MLYRIFHGYVTTDFADVALRALKDHPELTLGRGSVLAVLAQKPRAFKPKPSTNLARVIMNLFKSFLSTAELGWMSSLKVSKTHFAKYFTVPLTEISDIMRGPADTFNDETTATNPIDAKRKYSSRLLFSAAEVGCRQRYIYSWDLSTISRTTTWGKWYQRKYISRCVSHRHDNIYGLLYEICSTMDHIFTLADKYGNNMLHILRIFTESAKSNSYEYIPRSAQRMQQELLWFRVGHS